MRYLTDLLVQSKHDSVMPWGTLVVNALGSLVLGVTAGVVDGWPGHDWLLALVGTGFCGALTTFSTFSYETVRLLEERAHATAALNVLLSVGVGLAACAIGWAAAQALTG
jgi:CrcB protein